MGTTDQIFDVFRVALAWMVNILSSCKFLFGVPVGAILFGGIWFFFLRRSLRVKQVELRLPFGLGNITYEATDRDRVLAWKMYVQLKTRKAALPFDEEHDVIVDVFGSLHEIFPITRDLLSELNPHQGEAQKSIADFVLRVLNDGIRPHLTRWHATYQMWWNKAIDMPDNKGKSPQEVQRAFPQYADLTADMKRMNDELIKYAEELLAIVHASPTRGKYVKKSDVAPEQPIQQSRSASSGNAIVPTQNDGSTEDLPNKEMS